MSDLSKTIDSMGDAEFDELERLMGNRREQKRSRPTMDDIKPGMTKDDQKRVMDEITIQLRRAGRT